MMMVLATFGLKSIKHMIYQRILTPMGMGIITNLKVKLDLTLSILTPILG